MTAHSIARSPAKPNQAKRAKRAAPASRAVLSGPDVYKNGKRRWPAKTIFDEPESR